MLARKPRMLVTTALANKMARIVWGLLVKGGTYRAPAAAAKARRGHRGVGRAEGGHGATVGETGSGQPGCNTVLRVRHLDLDPLRELPCRPAAHGRARGRTDGSIRLRVTAFLMFSLALKGASTDVAWIRQESSRIRHLWRLADSEVSSLFNGLAYPCNKVAQCVYTADPCNTVRRNPNVVSTAVKLGTAP